MQELTISKDILNNKIEEHSSAIKILKKQLEKTENAEKYEKQGKHISLLEDAPKSLPSADLK